MSLAKRYFDSVTYKPKYFLGDRVQGKWNNIPFRGTVAVDHLVSEDIGSQVHVFLDLPIKYNDKIVKIITVTHKNLKVLK